MGVYIYLNILPDKIGEKEWENVYEESLKLIQAYSFMDSSVDVETYGIPWRYAHCAEEKEMETDFNETSKGWHVFGDYRTMLGAESFQLFKEIKLYRKQNNNEECADIVADLINTQVFYSEKNMQVPVISSNVFGNKTQGLPHHIHLLAIACLIESRFPKFAALWGDVSIGQMKKAIDWANSILVNPIHLTERANNEKMLERIRKIIQDEVIALKTFMALTMHGKDFRLGEFVRGKFSSDTIRTYFTGHLSEYNVETIGFHNSLSDFFNLGFSMDMACEICVLDANGCQFDAQAFTEVVLSMLWPGDKAYDHDTTYLDYGPERTTPDTVYSQLGGAFLEMAGFQESIKPNLSYDDVKAILQDKLGGVVEFPSLLENEKYNYDELDDTEVDDLFAQLKENVNKVDAENEYAIFDLDDLILWKKNDSLHPEIERALNRIRNFVREIMETRPDLYDEFHAFDDHDKIKRLIHLNNNFYIRKKTWDFYIDHIHQIDLIDTVFGILLIEADLSNTNKLCKAIVNNVELLKEYIQIRV